MTDEGPAGAPAILCLHGLPGSSRDFRYLAPLLAGHFRVVRLEMPGFGAAPRGTIESITGWARLAHAAADALGIGRFHLLGHSFGGGAAILAAGADPGRLSGLVLISSMGTRSHRAFTRPPQAWARLARLLSFPPARAFVIPIARRGYRARRLPFPHNWRDLQLHFRLTGSVDFAAIRAAAERITAPTLIFQAEDDHLVETAIAEDLARTIGRADLHLFETGGHNLQKSRAPEIAHAIIDTLAADATHGTRATPE